MGGKTKIEWCDTTWNPVTGCLHGCEYCYARGIARRFKGKGDLREVETGLFIEESRFKVAPDVYDVRYPLTRGERPEPCKRYNGIKTPYPFGFAPTFHRYRLDEPQTWKTPQTVFVCSMADLFGYWVPDEWIETVFEACAKAPQHTYLFLTKNPYRYLQLLKAGKLPEEHWYGATITSNDDSQYGISGAMVRLLDKRGTFISYEPMLGGFTGMAQGFICGAETGNRKNKVNPSIDWLEHLDYFAARTGAKVFHKNSLLPIMGEENMRRELPWALKPPHRGYIIPMKKE
jgi:protein gp37